MIQEPGGRSQHARQGRIDAFFIDVVALPHGERGAFLDGRCADESDSVRAEVELLLQADDRLQQENCRFLSPPAMNAKVLTADGEPGESMLGRPIGPYQITKRVGKGGFSDVYLAHRTVTVHGDIRFKKPPRAQSPQRIKV